MGLRWLSYIIGLLSTDAQGHHLRMKQLLLLVMAVVMVGCEATTPAKTTPAKTTPAKTTPAKTTPAKTTRGFIVSIDANQDSGALWAVHQRDGTILMYKISQVTGAAPLGSGHTCCLLLKVSAPKPFRGYYATNISGSFQDCASCYSKSVYTTPAKTTVGDNVYRVLPCKDNCWNPITEADTYYTFLSIAERTAAIKKASEKAQANAFTNTLGMKFVPVRGTKVKFCIWETRVKDYAAHASANEGVDVKWKSPGYTQMDTHPVGNVNWNDAQAFCAWLTKKELAEGKIKASQRYRLPTDAEWSVAVGLGEEAGNTPKEKAVGAKGIYPWGKEWPPPKGAGNYHSALNVDNFDSASPVGSFSANAYGIHDLGGNVSEWCEDWYDDPVRKTHRVYRGASHYVGTSEFLLSSYRGYHWFTSDFRNSLFGFRCVLTNGSGR
jgi:roadblock/LC7 domain-containing protein